MHREGAAALKWMAGGWRMLAENLALGVPLPVAVTKSFLSSELVVPLSCAYRPGSPYGPQFSLMLCMVLVPVLVSVSSVIAIVTTIVLVDIVVLVGVTIVVLVATACLSMSHQNRSQNSSIMRLKMNWPNEAWIQHHAAPYAILRHAPPYGWEFTDALDENIEIYGGIVNLLLIWRCWMPISKFPSVWWCMAQYGIWRGMCNSAEVVSGHCSLVIEVRMMDLVMDWSEVHGLFSIACIVTYGSCAPLRTILLLDKYKSRTGCKNDDSDDSKAMGAWQSRSYEILMRHGQTSCGYEDHNGDAYEYHNVDKDNGRDMAMTLDTETRTGRGPYTASMRIEDLRRPRTIGTGQWYFVTATGMGHPEQDSLQACATHPPST
ncbi:hypothetical protein CPB85DRAFT_1257441 [Mucidula mucida]|nr:hypothetical protein CPB85DRAFT_1257441 [Mucidula mucida]